MKKKGRKNYLISIFPLSAGYKNKISDVIRLEIDYLTLAQLRREGNLLKIFFFLISLNAENVIFAYENKNSESFLSIMTVLGLCISAKNKSSANEVCEIKKVSFLKSISGLFRILFYTLSNSIYKKKVEGYFKKILNQKAALPPVLNYKKGIYINPNLWIDLNAGGSVAHVSGVVNAFHNLGCDINYVAAERNMLLYDNVEFKKIEFETKIGLPFELNYYRISNDIVKLIGEDIKQNKPDFIYQRLSIGNYSGVILSQHFEVPLILEYNSSEVWCMQKWGSGLKYAQLASMAEEISLKYATRIVTVSAVLKEELIARGVNADKIVCYPNCVDPKRFNPENFSIDTLSQFRSELGYEQDALIYTFLGTFGKWHGTNFLSDVIIHLAEENENLLTENKIKFMFIGDGIELPLVKERLMQSKAAKYCNFMGLITPQNAPKYLAVSDVLLLPTIPNHDDTRFFGSPTKLFEYMAMGKPIIASDLEQIGEILHNSVRMRDKLLNFSEDASQVGVLCRVKNRDDFSSAIIFLAKNPMWRHLIGKNAREMVLKHFVWEAHVNAIINKRSFYE